MAVTLKDIATSCGVSIATVSRVLNNRTDGFSVKPANRDRILETARSLGYRRNVAAANLRTRKTDQILIFDFSFERRERPRVYDPMISTAGALLTKAGYQVCIAMAPHREEGEELLFPAMMDGAIVLQPDSQRWVMEELERIHVPYVAVNGQALEEGSTILFDDVDGMQQAMQHLFDLGHTRIAYRFNGNMDDLRHPSIRDREETYVAAMQAKGLTPVPDPKDSMSDGDFQIL